MKWIDGPALSVNAPYDDDDDDGDDSITKRNHDGKMASSLILTSIFCV